MVNFKIPVLDKILAGIPDNSRLRIEVSDLHAQLVQATERIKELEAKVEELEPKSGMKPDTAKILKEFFEKNGNLSESYIEHRFEMEKGMVGHHFSVLRRLGFIRQTRAGFNDSGAFGITDEGRDFVVENELV